MDTFKTQQGLAPYFSSAYGFAVFPKVAKGGMGVGGAFGKGDVYVNNKDGTEQKVGEAKLFQVSFGFQFGGQVYSEIIFFETEREFEQFQSGNFEFGAEAGAVALTASASASLSTLGNQKPQAGLKPEEQKMGNQPSMYTKGCSVYTVALGGLMYEATIAGQKFEYKSI